MERKKMNSYDFKNQVAVVTGGANGIGFSVAERLSKSGASVKIWDLDIEAAQTAAETINAEAVECVISRTGFLCKMQLKPQSMVAKKSIYWSTLQV